MGNNFENLCGEMLSELNDLIEMTEYKPAKRIKLLARLITKWNRDAEYIEKIHGDLN